MSIIEQIQQTKHEIKTTTASQGSEEREELKNTLYSLREYYQFLEASGFILKRLDKYTPSVGEIGPSLRAFAFHIVSHLYPLEPPEKITEIVDGLPDLIDDPHYRPLEEEEQSI